MTGPQQLVQKLWNYCNILRDDGLSYGDYVEQLTFLLFLKMAYQLPAPDFRHAFRRTEVILYGPQTFDDMDRLARIRTCYQHCALQWVLRREMTNQSLRKRFKLPENKTASISQTITATLEAVWTTSPSPPHPGYWFVAR